MSVKGLANREGLLHVSGIGQDSLGARPWAVVLKKPSFKPPILNSQPDHVLYWKRELDLIQSGLLGRLPGPVAAPRCYHTAEWQDCRHIWMEWIHDTS